MYESSGSQFFRTTTGRQSGPDAFHESRFVMTFLTILEVMVVLCSFRVVLEEKTGKEIPESSRLQFLEKFLANNFALSVHVQADHVSWLHKFAYFLAYCCILEKCSMNAFSFPDCYHMSVGTFQFLPEKFSQPPKFCVQMLHHLLIVLKEMSSIIASRHVPLIPRKVTAPNILPIAHLIHQFICHFYLQLDQLDTFVHVCCLPSLIFVAKICYRYGDLKMPGFNIQL